MENQPDPATYDEDATEEILMEQEAPVRGKLAQPFSWQATEGRQVSRGVVWYVMLGVVSVGLMALAIFVFKSITFAVLLVVIDIAVIVLTGKPPRSINYGISPKGIYVADKLYDFSEFRAFGVIDEPGSPSIIVLPVKRFSTGVTLYFNIEDGERIVDMLGARLPLQEVKLDLLEKVIRLIKL